MYVSVCYAMLHVVYVLRFAYRIHNDSAIPVSLHLFVVEDVFDRFIT